MDQTTNDIELRTRVLLRTYEAMLGMISNNVRMISIDWTENSFKIKAIYDRPVNEDDMDALKVISTEVAAGFPKMNDIKEFAEYSLEPFSELNGLKKLVFLRYGELEL
jgi:hypothetical protein